MWERYKCQFPLVVFPALDYNIPVQGPAGIPSKTIDYWMPGQARQDEIDTFAEFS
jgi:hypothetical protein